MNLEGLAEKRLHPFAPGRSIPSGAEDFLDAAVLATVVRGIDEPRCV